MKCLDANPLALNIPCENAFKFFCKELLLRLDISNNNYFSCKKKGNYFPSQIFIVNLNEKCTYTAD